jgi:hypothetical protein
MILIAGILIAIIYFWKKQKPSTSSTGPKIMRKPPFQPPATQIRKPMMRPRLPNQPLGQQF